MISQEQSFHTAEPFLQEETAQNNNKRREFLRASCAALVFACSGGAQKLLGEILPDEFKERGSHLTGLYVLRFADFPMLRNLNGSVRLQIPGAPLSLGRVIITRYQENTFSALSEICTHSGCPVQDFTNGRFHCICHGSTFTGDGRVVQGPATAPLFSLNVSYKPGDDFLHVDVPGLATSIKSETQYNSSLSQNYPNPASNSTIIEYTVAKESLVTLAIFSILGKEVMEIVRREHEPGQYRVTVDVSNLNKGVYFYRMDTSTGFSQTKKLTVA